MHHRLGDETAHRDTEAWVSDGLYFVPPPGHWERFSGINNSLLNVVKIFFRFIFSFFVTKIDFLFQEYEEPVYSYSTYPRRR